LNLLPFWANFLSISISLYMQPTLAPVTWICAFRSSCATRFPDMPLVEIFYKS
jgi:hypothetical protein